ncbi:MEDS domain-containing protein [Actinacidiphila sp. DG2A-62]|uniref:MEDS domain-containing protein n=1 Tax=Actinacidiphila sp. DG2A-62 TaxID=3108821 RepID=UPI002DB9312C|nr:MEDS domain-containing protein [Actinacidiphila sp. DG2A-62]MEC3998714.1 MEDS domain-containing protein [Actinacidiphila sp. DG2A-62]
MRIARSVASLGLVDIGDHVCWVVPAQDDFHGTARGYLSDGTQLGDKIMVVGPSSAGWPELLAPQSLLVDPAAGGAGPGGVGWDVDALAALVRREAETADRQGFRALRVLAHMDRIWPAGITAEQVADQELRLDAVIGGTAAMVVCAYPTPNFSPSALEQAASVHPHFTGHVERAPSFHLFHDSADCWSVTGVVDAEGADAFGTALAQLLRTTPTLRLRCEGLQLMDAAGLQTLAWAAAALPGRKVLLIGANPVVRKCWDLLGFDDPGVPAELVP